MGRLLYALRSLGLILATLVCGLGFLWFCISLDQEGYNSQMPYSRSHPLEVSGNAGIPIDGYILAQLAKKKPLNLQRGIGSVPAISSFSIANRLARITSLPVTPKLRFSVNLPVFLEEVTHKYGRFSPGGLIIYGTNLENVGDLVEYKNLVSTFRDRFTFTVYVKVSKRGNAESGLYQVRIEPLVVADCDLSYREFRYCRGPFLSTLVNEGGVSQENRREKIRKIIKEFSEIGLKSTLSPEVDVYPDEDVGTMVDLAKTASIAATDYGMIPTLKHFLYNRNLGDAHESSFYNPLTITQFHDQLQPYYAIDSLNIPFFLMLSHHRIALDPVTPLSASKKVRAFVDSSFRNAITMSDAVNMDGLHKGKTLRAAVSGLQTDTFLFHSGNVLSYVPDIIRGLDDSQSGMSAVAVERMLKLKQRLGLVKITRLQ